MTRLPAWILALAALSTSAHAATWSVPGDFSTLQAAADSLFVSSGDTLVLTSNQSGFFLNNGKSLTIQGQGFTLGPSPGLPSVVYVDDSSLVLDSVVLDGEWSNQALYIETNAAVTVLDSTLTNGIGQGDGGCIFVNNSTLELDGVLVDGCQTQGRGGAISLDVGDVQVRNSVIEDTFAGQEAGAFYVRNGSFELDNSAVSLAETNGQGGAFSCRQSQCIVSDRALSDLTASDDGGAIAAQTSSNVTLVDSHIQATVGRDGGAVAIRNGILSVERSRFEQVAATESGGAIFAENADVTVSNAYFCGNLADNDTVGIDAEQADSLQVQNALFTDPGFDSTTAVFQRVIAAANDGTIRNVSVVGVGSPQLDGRGSTTLTDNLMTGQDVVGLDGSGVSQDNLLWGPSVQGSHDTNAQIISDPGLIGDTASSCATLFGLYPTASLDTSTTQIDADGTAGDAGHLGGPGLDVDWWGSDADGDGALVTTDCDDSNPSISPAGTEICDNGIDENCDGMDLVGATWYSDADGDGFGDDLTATIVCGTPPAGLVSDGGDCDDANAGIHPLVDETCNGIDDDCNGLVDDDDPGLTNGFDTWPDDDGDGFGPDDVPATVVCVVPSGVVQQAGDCDDTDPDRSPASQEACVDGIDNDCDGLVDADDPDFVDFATDWWADDDGDTYGDPSDVVTVCASDVPPGYVSPVNGADCDDTMGSVNPAASEICNGIDDDCVGGADDGITADFYPDTDGDGFGDAGAMPDTTCDPAPGATVDDTDCDDTDDRINPSENEVCDGLDNDCNSQVDDGLTFVTVYPDVDGDTYGDENAGISVCETPAGHILTGGDCDDSDPAVNPAAVEIRGDGIDNDCDGLGGPVDTGDTGDTGDTAEPGTDLQDSDGDGVPDVIDPAPNSAGDETGSPPGPQAGCACNGSGPTGLLGGWAFIGLVLARRISRVTSRDDPQQGASTLPG